MVLGCFSIYLIPQHSIIHSNLLQLPPSRASDVVNGVSLNTLPVKLNAGVFAVAREIAKSGARVVNTRVSSRCRMHFHSNQIFHLRRPDDSSQGVSRPAGGKMTAIHLAPQAPIIHRHSPYISYPSHYGIPPLSYNLDVSPCKFPSFTDIRPTRPSQRGTLHLS